MKNKRKEVKVYPVRSRLSETIDDDPGHSAFNGVEKSVEKKMEFYQTTDRFLAHKLTGMGFKIKDVVNPFGDRDKKLYIFEETREQIEEKIYG